MGHSFHPRRPHIFGWAAAFLIGLPFSSRAADVEPSKKYQAAVQPLERFIQRQVSEKRLPALSIALVDDQEIVWAKGFGFANPQAKVPATADTVYRVGSFGAGPRAARAPLFRRPQLLIGGDGPESQSHDPDL